MKFEIENAPVSIEHINLRKEGKDDAKDLAVDIKVYMRTDPGILACFDPTLRHFLFNEKDEARFPMMGAFGWSGEVVKAEAEIGEEKFYGVSVKKFEIGTSLSLTGKAAVALTFTMSFKPSAREAALLAELIGEKAWLTIKKNELPLV